MIIFCKVCAHTKGNKTKICLCMFSRVCTWLYLVLAHVCTDMGHGMVKVGWCKIIIKSNPRKAYKLWLSHVFANDPAWYWPIAREEPIPIVHNTTHCLLLQGFEGWVWVRGRTKLLHQIHLEPSDGPRNQQDNDHCCIHLPCHQKYVRALVKKCSAYSQVTPELLFGFDLFFFFWSLQTNFTFKTLTWFGIFLDNDFYPPNME